MKFSVLLFILASAGGALAAASQPGLRANGYCRANSTWIGPAADAGATLPRHCINTSIRNTPSPGATIPVPAGANISDYLAQADCGDILMLAPGQYPPFVLPAKNCSSGLWITIQSRARQRLPGPNVRISPCFAGVVSLPGRPAYPCRHPQKLMATISSLRKPDISAAPGANFYRIGPGIEITRPDSAAPSAALVQLTGADHIIFDRVWAHGTEQAGETVNGFGLTGATNVAVINSYLDDFKCISGKGGSCTDAHAFSGGDDPAGLPEGTWKIYNNFIEASGENILFGGALAGAATPADIEIRLNHLYKNPAWNPRSPDYVQPYPGFNGYIVKNIFELKNARRVLFEGNRLEYSWGGFSQRGFAILLSPRGSWAYVDDVTIRFNYISHVGDGFQIVSTRNCSPSSTNPLQCKTGSMQVADSGGLARINLHDTLTDDVNGNYYQGAGNMAQLSSEFRVNTPLTNVTLNHNTFVTDGTEGLILVTGTIPTNPQPQMGPVAFTNNITRAGQYNGIWDVGNPSVCAVDMNPSATFGNCFTESYLAGNLVVGWGEARKAPDWPAGNETPSDFSTVFVNPLLSGGDYHVLPPYQNAGTDGRDLGADIDRIMLYMQRAQ